LKTGAVKGSVNYKPPHIRLIELDLMLDLL